MRPVIKVLIAVLTITLLTNFSCRKSVTEKAVITGFDARMCACCGGLMINFEGKAEAYEGNFYLIRNDPNSLGISNNTSFPIYADVTWELEPQSCSSEHPFINITSIVIH